MVFYDVIIKMSGYLYVISNSYFHELWGIQEILIEWSTSVNSVLSNMGSNMRDIELIMCVIQESIKIDPR